MKDKGRRSREQAKASDNDAGLTPMKKERKGGLAGKKCQTPVQF